MDKNYRQLPGIWFHLHCAGLSRYAWFRRHIGGHWEQWWIDVVNSGIWIPTQKCFLDTDKSYDWMPPLGRGKPYCEVWPDTIRSLYGYRTYIEGKPIR